MDLTISTTNTDRCIDINISIFVIDSNGLLSITNWLWVSLSGKNAFCPIQLYWLCKYSYRSLIFSKIIRFCYSHILRTTNSTNGLQDSSGIFYSWTLIIFNLQILKTIIKDLHCLWCLSISNEIYHCHRPTQTDIYLWYSVWYVFGQQRVLCVSF